MIHRLLYKFNYLLRKLANDFPWIESRLRWLEKGDQCAEILRSGQIQCRMFEVLREENWDRVRFEFNCLKIHASQNVRLVMRVWVARAHTGMSFFRKKFSILLKLFVYSKDCAIFSCNFFWNYFMSFFSGRAPSPFQKCCVLLGPGP